MSKQERYGRFEIRPIERKLLIDGRPAELGARTFDLLLALTAQRGELVTKDALLSAAWPGLVVEESNIQVQVSALRKLLGHGAITTVPGLGYRFSLAPDDAAEGAEPRVHRLPSVAVLAFDGFSSDLREDVLGEGFADDLITELALNSAITVMARNTSFSVKGRGLTAQAIARDLGVSYVVEGSLRRIGEEVLVNAQLIDGVDGRHVWAERCTFGAGDVYAVQAGIVGRIAGTLFSSIRASETSASLRKPPANLDVYELTLRGAAHERQQTRDSMIAGRAELERATELDPLYAPARVWLGYLMAGDAVSTLSGRAGIADLPAATAQIRRGIALDPTLALGYQALSYALSYTDDLDETLVAAERAVALAPGDADNFNFLSRAQLIVGQYEAALASVERAITLNPLMPALYLMQRARVLYALDRFSEASRDANVSAPAFPGVKLVRLIGAAADVARGAPEQATAWIAPLLQREPNFNLASPVLGPFFKRDPQKRQRLLDHLRAAGVPDRP